MNPPTTDTPVQRIARWVTTNPAIVRSLLVALFAAIGLQVGAGDFDSIVTVIVLIAGGVTGAVVKPAVTPNATVEAKVLDASEQAYYEGLQDGHKQAQR